MALPGFYEDFLNMDNTLGLPHDSADGYMYDFAVNLETLKYLQLVNALTPEAEDKAIAYMQSSKSLYHSVFIVPHILSTKHH